VIYSYPVAQTILVEDISPRGQIYK
jgi:hypothetical protein